MRRQRIRGLAGVVVALLVLARAGGAAPAADAAPRALAAAAPVAVPAAAAGPPARYARRGGYLWFTDTQILAETPCVRIYLDGGIPMVDYGDFTARNPTTIAQYALSRFGAWHRDGDPRGRRAAVRAARFLVASQRRDGSWRYDFPYQVGILPELPAGWPSALAQGQVISLLVRVHAVTRERRYLDAARAAVGPLTRPIARGGLRTRFDGGLWLEEYPTRPRRSFVLNGFMFALVGLYDIAPRSPAAARLYREGRRTLVRALPRFDAGGGCSLYALTPDPTGAPWRISDVYEPIHVGLLATLDQLRPHPVLRRYARRWQPGCP